MSCLGSTLKNALGWNVCWFFRQDQNVLKPDDKMLTVTFTLTVLSQYLYSQCHHLLVMHL